MFHVKRNQILQQLTVHKVLEINSIWQMALTHIPRIKNVNMIS